MTYKSVKADIVSLWKNLKSIWPSFVRALLIAFACTLILFGLDYCNIPSWFLNLPGWDWPRNLFSWTLDFYGRGWGQLATFIVGVLAGALATRETEETTKKINSAVDEIKDAIRSPLKDFPQVYDAVLKLLKEANEDAQSCFLIVTPCPIVGIDDVEKELVFSKALKVRLKLEEHESGTKYKTRIVCLSPFAGHKFNNDVEDSNDWKESDLGKFLASLENFQKNGGEKKKVRCAKEMFIEVKRFFRDCHIAQNKGVDVIVKDHIPYQLFIMKKGNGDRKCVLLLAGRDSLEEGLPPCGFITSDTTFIDIIENSAKVYLGNDVEHPYDLRQLHTKEIIVGDIKYADECKSPIDYKKVSSRDGIELIRYPYVFNPDSESTWSMAKECKKEVGSAVLRNSTVPKETIVYDIGCGTGLLTILAKKYGADKVYGVDHQRRPIECTKDNINLNLKDVPEHLGIQLLQGDLFEPIVKANAPLADVILADLPFLDAPPIDGEDPVASLASAYFDPGQETNIQFLRKAKDHLAENGRVILSFSSLDPVKSFERIIREYNWIIERDEPYLCKNGINWHAFVLKKR